MRMRRIMPGKRAKGFTLFEIILAASIFVLLAGAVYYCVEAGVRSATTLADRQIAIRTQDAFEEFLRDGFINLAPEADMSLQTRNLGERGRSVDLVIRRASGGFSTGFLEADGCGVVLSALPDGKGKATISMLRFPDNISTADLAARMEGKDWLPLLHDVDGVRWRFREAQRRDFVEDWTRGKPVLMELTYSILGESRVTMFRIPETSGSAAGGGEEN